MGQQITPPGSGQPVATPPQGQQQPAPAAAPAAAPATGQPDPFAGIQTEGRTPAEIEAEYRARLGGHQRGWNAAEQALRAENETLRQRLLTGASQGSNGQSGDPNDAVSQQMAELRRQVEQAERGRQAAEKRAKYPNLSATFADSKVFEALDDADLAKLNATLEENIGGGTFIAPTAPRRAASPPAQSKPINERSKDELLADLRRLAPQVAEQERQRAGRA